MGKAEDEKVSGVGYRDLLRGRRWPAPGTLKLTARGTSLCLRSTHKESNMLSGVKLFSEPSIA
jgi:hypothetical protein